MAAEEAHSQQRSSESEPKYTPEEAQEIYQRAAEIHAETLFPEDEKLSKDQLEDNAERVGIDEKYVEQAIAERQEELRREAQEKQEQEEQARLAAAQRAQWAKRGAVVGGLFVCLLGVSAWRTQAQLSDARATVEARQAQVENVLERRHELVPGLMRVTKATLEQQQGLIQSLNQANQQAKAATPAQRSTAESQLEKAIQSTLEKLDAKAGSSGVVLRLTDEMAGAANRISVERKRYNEAVQQYNRLAGTFPASKLGPMMGFPQQYDYFRASDASRQTPEF